MRFAFWGAEERGLIGSRHHVASLSEDERRQIAVYVNLDMVGSPNFARFVRSSAATPEGLAAVIRDAFIADFRAHDLASEQRTGGRFGSDDASFSQKGIATVGLYTGAAGGNRRARLSCSAARPIAHTIPVITVPVTRLRTSAARSWNRTPERSCGRCALQSRRARRAHLFPRRRICPDQNNRWLRLNQAASRFDKARAGRCWLPRIGADPCRSGSPRGVPNRRMSATLQRCLVIGVRVRPVAPKFHRLKRRHVTRTGIGTSPGIDFLWAYLRAQAEGKC